MPHQMKIFKEMYELLEQSYIPSEKNLLKLSNHAKLEKLKYKIQQFESIIMNSTQIINDLKERG